MGISRNAFKKSSTLLALFCQTACSNNSFTLKTLLLFFFFKITKFELKEILHYAYRKSTKLWYLNCCCTFIHFCADVVEFMQLIKTLWNYGTITTHYHIRSIWKILSSKFNQILFQFSNFSNNSQYFYVKM